MYVYILHSPKKWIWGLAMKLFVALLNQCGHKVYAPVLIFDVPKKIQLSVLVHIIIIYISLKHFIHLADAIIPK